MNRVGDWTCHTCNFIIFGRKDKCYKCGTTRPEISKTFHEANSHNKKNLEYKNIVNDLWKDIIEEKQREHKHRLATDPVYATYVEYMNQPCPNHYYKGETRASCYKCN